jgi:hypothetical protein
MANISDREVALTTQMRAGTHYMCAALRTALEATIHRPDRENHFVIMDDDYIRKGLYGEENIILTRPRTDRHVYFCHYYHPQIQLLAGKPRIQLIGFPLDSFYSDGVIARSESNNPAPSGPRAANYVMRFGESEWRSLEGYMEKNADWLLDLSESSDRIIIRYEDLIADFQSTAERLELFVGGFVNALPPPKKNPRRSYWTEDYAACFDREALNAMWTLFGRSIERFYPERVSSLKAAL